MGVVDRFVSYQTGPAAFPGEPGAVIRRDRQHEFEMVNLRWGWDPSEPGSRLLTHLRSEGRRVGNRRCLIPASQFPVTNRKGGMGRKGRVGMVRDALFYLPAVWRPGNEEGPASYALLTIPANPDIAPFHDRQVAVIPAGEHINWLDHLKAQEELLKPLPKGTFWLEQTAGPPQTLFNFSDDAAESSREVRAQ